MLDLDEDPTPGDPERVKQLARELHDFAGDVADALRQIKGMAGEDALLRWAGKTAKAFQDEFEEVPKNLKKLQRSYDLAGDALAAYWPKLERAQSLADRALARGREARNELSSATGRLDSANSWVERATAKTEEYDEKEGKEKPDESEVRAATRNATDARSARASAQTAVDNAESGLEAAKKMAADAKKMREDAASEAKDKLEDASDAGIQNRKWWEKAVDWVKDNWDTIVTVCKVIVAVLGIVVLIIGGPLAWVVLAAALVVLADTLIKYLNGEASLWDVAFAALDCIPGMKGLTTLGGLAKGLKGGLNAMKSLKGMRAAVLGLAKRGRTMLDDAAQGAHNRLKNVVSKLTDPVDLATGAMYLPQTDVRLPGLLPLVFTRRISSAYRAGGWFGPTWASTIDQHLEVDERGVVFATCDGRLLAYAHPSDTEPTTPENGPCWPLASLDTGGYSVTDPVTGHSRRFASPDADGVCRIEQIVDLNGHSVDFTYEADGSPTGLVHSGGYHLKLTTDDDRVSALHLAGAAEDGSDIEIKRFGYDEDGNLTDDINSSGLPLRYTYDERLRITSWTDRNDRSYRYTYDEHDRCIAEGGEAGHLAITLEYDAAHPAWPDHRVTVLTTTEGHKTHFVINDNCQIVAEIDPLGHTTRSEYDARHRPLSSTDALGHTTRYTTNPHGQPVEVVYPDGSTVRREYNTRQRLAAVHLPDGTSWSWEYDDRGNLIRETDATGATTQVSVDDAGRQTAIIDPLGNSTTVLCNPAGLPAEIIDPLGGTSRYERDSLGRPVAHTDALGATTRLEWTPEGHLATRTGPDGAVEKWRYDGEGNCTSHIDAAGRQTTYEYTHFDLLTARKDPDGSRHTFDYDAGLHLVRVTNPQGNTWNYRYDASGRLVGESDYDDRTTGYTLDAAGRLALRTNPLGQTITYSRDPLGRIVAKDAEGQVTHYRYDPVGRLKTATGPDATLTYELDEIGRVLSERVNGHTTTYVRDAAGNLVTRTTPTGTSTRYHYDAAGNRTQVTTDGHTLAFEHDLAGREITRRSGSITLTTGWDSAGRLAHQSLAAGPGATLIQQRSYTYRPDGHLSALDDHLAGEQNFGLDPAGRVTAVGAADWNESYAYDALGNQTHAAWPPHHAAGDATGERSYEGTTLIRAGRFRYQHDAAGRLVLRQKINLSKKPDSWHFTYDAEDHLTESTTPDAAVWRYRYDPLGRRCAKQRLAADGTTVVEESLFTYDGATLIEQSTTSGPRPDTVTQTWNHDGLAPVSQHERLTDTAAQEEIDSRFFAIVTDLVGTPRELIDPSNGEIAWRTRTTLWGTAAHLRVTADTPLRFPGQYADPETGLYYNINRYYDPSTARYTTPDPLGLSPAPNPLTYVTNPHTWVDPLGLAPQGDVEWVDPEDINFSQRTVTENDYADRMRAGDWDWSRPDAPLDVMDVDGQLVSYDNRRLDAAREIGQPVPVRRVDPNAPHPASTTGRTWGQQFQRRMNSGRNRNALGEPVPRQGLSERPRHLPPGGCGR
nr:DUF6531 domain-containing protein [Streptomyces sp. CMB-StM0423]